MKELSIEQKARRYDEAIERANNLHKDAVEMENNMTTKTCEIIFPELKESEDERIRKALIKYFTLSDEHAYNEACGVSYRDIIAWLEKQGDSFIKWNKNTKDNKPPFNHSVLMLTKSGISEGEWQGGNQWLQYRWSGIVRDSDVIGWMELSVLEKQGEQKSIEVRTTGYWNVQDIERKFSWSEEDEKMLNDILMCGEHHCYLDAGNIAWLKSLKERYSWKPSDEQMNLLEELVEDNNQRYFYTILRSLYEQLKKLREE